MSRRRSSNPTKAISITLKESTIRQIDESLSYTQSRSALIQRAVNRYLDGSDMKSIGEWSVNGIVSHLLVNRNLTDHQKELLLLFSSSLEK